MTGMMVAALGAIALQILQFIISAIIASLSGAAPVAAFFSGPPAIAREAETRQMHTSANILFM
jgi:hypothetical protein